MKSAVAAARSERTACARVLTRDMELGAVPRTNEMLADAGVAAELHVREGMWHTFFSDPELPEAQAADRATARFFECRLGVAGSTQANAKP